MKIYNILTLSNGNQLLIYQDESDDSAGLYYYDYSNDTDTFICEVSDEDISLVCY